MTNRASITQAAGKATANAIRSINTNGINHPDTGAALEKAVVLTNTAQLAGATVTEIRQAGGLPNS